ncbi:hypothetical protein NKH77_05150 [Streptomyces sp. M19]
MTSLSLEEEGAALIARGLGEWNRGLREEALRTTRQGAAVLRELAAERPTTANQLATALSNLGGMLRQCGSPGRRLPSSNSPSRSGGCSPPPATSSPPTSPSRSPTRWRAARERALDASLAPLAESVAIYRSLARDEGRASTGARWPRP